jgi:hypothetical protein
MTPKRGAPVMVELMKRQSARARGTAPEGTDPYASPNQPGLLPAGQEPSNSGLEDPGEALNRHAVRGQQLQFWGVLIAAIVVLITLTAILAFRFGETTGRQEGVKFSDGGNGALTPVRPGTPGGGLTGTPDVLPQPVEPDGGASVRQFGPDGAQIGGGASGVTIETELRPGWNYLVVATLRRDDAEVSARFLAENGVPVRLIAVGSGRTSGGGGVDRRGEARKDSLWQVIVLRGIPPTEFSARRAERDELVRQIVGLGKAWRSRDRSVPTNFAEPFWDRID